VSTRLGVGKRPGASQRLAVIRRRMRANANRASAAIEFALIAPVFFVLLLGIMEVGVMFYAQNTLQLATQTAARLIRTGAAQGTDYTTAARCSGGAGGTGSGGAYNDAGQWFKDQICCGISAIMSCSRLQVDVESYANGFNNANFSNPLDANGNIKSGNSNYAPGNSCDVVLVRSFYTWPVITPVLSFFLVDMANESHLMVATSAFRNEPYANVAGGC
jgi:Flp pilus assembly protein TadG